MKKNKIWDWTPKCQVAFELLKECFLSAPVLMMPDTTKPFIVETDASTWAIGAAIMQKDDSGQIHPCGYLSHALTPTECNWQIYNCKLYAIIYALEEWRYLLLSADQTIMVHCDHKNLTYYRSPQCLTAQQARWWNNLSQYNLKLIHIPGSKLIQADTLSRCPDHVSGEIDNEDIVMLPNDLFINLIAEDLKTQIKLQMELDPLLQTILDCQTNNTPPPLQSTLSDWQIEDGLLLYKNLCFVPNNTN